MTPLTVLVLGVGLAVVGTPIKSQEVDNFLVLLAFAGFVGALIFIWFGAAGATDDVGSSWSDPGPQEALRWAGSCAAAVLASVIALVWRYVRKRRSARR
jgi:hypothetical protein